MHAQWEELYVFFATGDPPLAVQLLIVNTLFLVVMLARRIRGAAALRSESYLLVQSLLIFANAFIIFEGQIAGFLGLSI